MNTKYKYMSNYDETIQHYKDHPKETLPLIKLAISFFVSYHPKIMTRGWLILLSVLFINLCFGFPF